MAAQIRITKHAYERLRDRLRVPAARVEAFVRDAFDYGRPIRAKREGQSCKAYDRAIWVFHKRLLVTVFRAHR